MRIASATEPHWAADYPERPGTEKHMIRARER